MYVYLSVTYLSSIYPSIYHLSIYHLSSIYIYIYIYIYLSSINLLLVLCFWRTLTQVLSNYLHGDMIGSQLNLNCSVCTFWEMVPNILKRNLNLPLWCSSKGCLFHLFKLALIIRTWGIYQCPQTTIDLIESWKCQKLLNTGGKHCEPRNWGLEWDLSHHFA
jgi:hypothetical protein